MSISISEVFLKLHTQTVSKEFDLVSVFVQVDADEGREKGWFLGQPVPWAT